MCMCALYCITVCSHSCTASEPQYSIQYLNVTDVCYSTLMWHSHDNVLHRCMFNVLTWVTTHVVQNAECMMSLFNDMMSCVIIERTSLLYCPNTIHVRRSTERTQTWHVLYSVTIEWMSLPVPVVVRHHHHTTYSAVIIIVITTALLSLSSSSPLCSTPPTPHLIHFTRFDP